jgi:FMN-dependent NADH-azoreductase
VTTIFRLDASIRQNGSVTRSVADSLQLSLEAELDTVKVVRRDIGLAPLPSTSWIAASGAGFTPVEERSQEQRDAIALVTTLGDELEQADVYIIATPLYNWGVSEHVKTWVDLLLTDPRFSSRSTRPAAGRPAYLLMARGGDYSPGSARADWDHATAWTRHILETIWGLDVTVIDTDLTLADVNPAMADLRPLAARKLEDSHAIAAQHGKSLAGRLGEDAVA